MTIKFATPIFFLAAGLSLAACNKSVPDAQADAVRATTEAEAANTEAMAQGAGTTGGVTRDAMGSNGTAGTTMGADSNAENRAEDKADAIRDAGEAKADAIEEGKIGATTKTDTGTTTTTPTNR